MPTPSPGPSDPDAISAAVDDMEERVVGRRVDPPHSADLADDAEDHDTENHDAEDHDGRDEAEDRGSGTEPSD